MVNALLILIRRKFFLVYPNKVVAFSRPPRENVNLEKQVSLLFREAKGTLRLRKCKMFTETIDYHRLSIRPQHPEIATHTEDAINGRQTPTNITKLYLNLGLCTVSRRFVPDFALVAVPLNDKLATD